MWCRKQNNVVPVWKTKPFLSPLGVLGQFQGKTKVDELQDELQAHSFNVHKLL